MFRILLFPEIADYTEAILQKSATLGLQIQKCIDDIKRTAFPLDPRIRHMHLLWATSWRDISHTILYDSMSEGVCLTNSKTFVKYVGELLHGCATNSIFRHVLYCNSQNIIVFCTCGHQPLSWVFIIYFFFFFLTLRFSINTCSPSDWLYSIVY